MGKLIMGALVGALGGAVSGAVLGVGESILVTWTSAAAEEYWLFLFAVLAYGLIGALFGIGAASFWQLVRRGRAGSFEISQLGAGLGFLFPALFVTRYHVSKRIFNEQLGFGTASGLIAHVLILIGVVLAALLVVGLVRILYRRLGSVGPVIGFAVATGIALVVGAVAGTSVEAAPERRASGDTSRPNVILVVADTLRADAVTNRIEQAPQGGFARLRTDGVTFERAQAQASWTRPSVASILTSLYPSSHGAVHKLDFLSNRVQTLAEVMAGAGFWTSGFTTNINVAPIFNLNQGFGEFSYLEPSFYFGATDSATKLVIYKTLRTLRERFFANRVFYEHFYQDALVVNANVGQWLGEKPPEPFFLFVHYMDPHDPYFEHPYNGQGVARVTNPSPPAERRDELRRLYLDGVAYLDEHVKTLIETLQEAGVYDDSVVIFTSDHGEEFYEHQGWWHGTTLYDEQLHVPLIVKLPANRQGGTRRADPARTIDIGPSILGAAGMPVPEGFQGIDLMRDRVREPLIAEEDLEGNRIFSILDGDWKLILANADNPRGLAATELYNLADDPGEQNNLADSQAAKVAELEGKLRSMLPPGTL
jgi:arylsulfatase A-like enzyme